MAAMVAGLNVFAQEFDDMYFTAKDRAKINQQARESMVLASAKEKGTSLQTINPSDSYSARNENPDYVAGAKTGSNANQSTSSYFSSSYIPKVNQNLYNCNCSNGYNSYGTSYSYGNPYFSNYGYGMNGFGSPYSSFYPYGYGMYGMGMSPGMSLGFGYGMGSYMWGSPSMNFWNSYYGMGSYYSYGYPYYGYGYGYGMGGYYGGYSPYTVVNNYNADNTSNVVYGRRPNRGGSVVTQSSYYTNSRNSTAIVDGNGRLRGAAAHTQYYQSGWRGEASRGAVSHTSSGARTSFWGSGSNSNTGSYSNYNNPGWGFRGSSSNWGGNSGFNARSSGFGGGFSGGGGGGFSGGGGGGHAGGGGRGGRH